MEQIRRIAIIGNGCAAAECTISLRRCGYRDEIVIFSDNDLPVANPMLTTYYASGKIPYEAMFPYGMDFYRRQDVVFRGGDPVTALRGQQRVVETAGGARLSFDRCLIASGARAVRPPVPGMGTQRVLCVRTVADSRLLRRAAGLPPGHIVVVGASMVGIKIVEMFHNLGWKVTLADLAPHVFPLAASERCARLIEERLTAQGVVLQLSASLSGVEERRDGGLTAQFGQGTQECDLLAMCVGVRANTDFLDRNEIAVDKGVLVDCSMRTSLPHIYAAGDVAQGMNLATGKREVIGLLAGARRQGRAAGRRMLGECGELHGNLLHNLTHFMGMDFVGIGDAREYDRVEERREGGGLLQFFFREGRLSGVNMLDGFENAGVLQHTVVKMLLGGADWLVPGTGTGNDNLRSLIQLDLLDQLGWKENGA